MLSIFLQAEARRNCTEFTQWGGAVMWGLLSEWALSLGVAGMHRSYVVDSVGARTLVTSSGGNCS